MLELHLPMWGPMSTEGANLWDRLESMGSHSSMHEQSVVPVVVGVGVSMGFVLLGIAY